MADNDSRGRGGRSVRDWRGREHIVFGRQPDTIGLPRRKQPRKIRYDLLAGGGLLSLVGQPLIGIEPKAIQYLIPGQMGRTAGGVWGSGGTLAQEGVIFRAHGSYSPGWTQQGYAHWDYQAIHGFLDPDGPQLPYSIVYSDLVYVNWISGTDVHYFCGFFEFNTSTDETSVVGVGFYTEGSGQTWKCIAKDGTSTPSNSLHNEDSSVDSGELRSLAIVLDGALHQVLFYIDSALVSTWAPTAVPGQMGSGGVKFGSFGIHNPSTSADLYLYGGGNPRLLSIVDNGVL